MTEQLGGIPGIAASSYPSDDRLLEELRGQWPPAVPPRDAGRGYVATDLAATPPVGALRLADRYAVAVVPESAGSFVVVPLVRGDVLVTAWRHARPGDGLSALVAGVPMASEAALAADQTNASVVVGDRAIVKWFRHVGPGPSRAALLLAHLDEVGFAEIPTPLGSLTWARTDGPDLTIAQGDAFLPGARDGWDWCVERLEWHVSHAEDSCPADCDPWFGARLGEMVARLHAALATPSAVIADPIASAEPADVGTWQSYARATLNDALAITLEQQPDTAPMLRSIESAIRADLHGLPVDRPIGIQPVHGDLHVGQVLEWSGELAVIDFDGNPALGDEHNALRQPPERDIAQMLSSLDHVGRIVDERTAGAARTVVETWIVRTRGDFLGALARPPDRAILAAFEAEQECRELVYAARFLPRWRYAPLATLRARYGI